MKSLCFNWFYTPYLILFLSNPYLFVSYSDNVVCVLYYWRVHPIDISLTTKTRRLFPNGQGTVDQTRSGYYLFKTY